MALQFNDATNENGFCQEIDSICKTNTTSYPLKSKARRMNNALDVYFQKSMVWCGNWSVGDINNITDLSSATTATTAYQDYRLNSSMLVLESVWYKETGKDYAKLDFTPDNLIDTTDTGVPSKYTKSENSIIFDVIPSTGTIKIYFRRILPVFVSTDTTKTSGAPAMHDFYLARLASMPYLIENGMPTKNDVAVQIQQDEIMAKDYYNFRGRDERKGGRLRSSSEDTR